MSRSSGVEKEVHFGALLLRPGLAEALELTLLILAKEPAHFRAAALRWHSRYCAETRASLEEAAAVLGLLAMLEGRRAKTAARALADLLDSRTLLPAGEVLMRWAEDDGLHPPRS